MVSPLLPCPGNKLLYPFPVSLSLGHNPEPSLRGHGSTLCPTTLPWQPCSCFQANTCPLFTEGPVIKGFLDWDRSLRLSDKVRGIPALSSILGQGGASEPTVPIQLDTSSPLPFGDFGIYCSVDCSSASGLAPLGSEPKAYPCVVGTSRLLYS